MKKQNNIVKEIADHRNDDNLVIVLIVYKLSDHDFALSFENCLEIRK